MALWDTSVDSLAGIMWRFFCVTVYIVCDKIGWNLMLFFMLGFTAPVKHTFFFFYCGYHLIFIVHEKKSTWERYYLQANDDRMIADFVCVCVCVWEGLLSAVWNRPSPTSTPQLVTPTKVTHDRHTHVHTHTGETYTPKHAHREAADVSWSCWTLRSGFLKNNVRPVWSCTGI